MKVKRDEMRAEADREVWKEQVETIGEPSDFQRELRCANDGNRKELALDTKIGSFAVKSHGMP